MKYIFGTVISRIICIYRKPCVSIPNMTDDWFFHNLALTPSPASSNITTDPGFSFPELTRVMSSWTVKTILSTVIKGYGPSTMNPLSDA